MVASISARSSSSARASPSSPPAESRPSNIYHRVVVDLGHFAPDEARERLDALPPGLWQTVSPPVPPYAVPFLDAHYRARGRADLCDPEGHGFPAYRATAARCLLLRTGHGVSAAQLAAARAALGYAR